MHERDILLAALELTQPLEREAYLAQVCGTDLELRSRVERSALPPAEAARSLRRARSTNMRRIASNILPSKFPLAGAWHLLHLHASFIFDLLSASAGNSAWV